MQKWSKHPTAAIKVAFVLFDQFSNMCLANCLEPMRAANTLAHQRVFDWSFLTLDGAAVHTSSGLPILPQGQLKDIEFVDYLFVLSATCAEHTRRLGAAVPAGHYCDRYDQTAEALKN